MLKVMSIFGTRPEAIKMAPIILELKRNSDTVDNQVVVTAQHRQMLDQVLEIFDITPDYDLDIMQKNQTPTVVAASVLSQIEPILKKEKPDWVLVQGDTTTVAVVSLAAFYARIKIGHVEAGLRTHEKWQPFPEEINRRVAGVIADLHFAPTRRSRENLLKEGISDKQIFITGNPVIDALNRMAAKPADLTPLNLPSNYNKLILVTAHRRENFGKPLENICQALREIAKRYNDQIQIVYPVHMNPNVHEPVYRFLKDLRNIMLVKPLDYLTLVHLMKISSLVLTDSGGIQEEAPGLGKPVLVLREVTERPEAVEAGTVKIVGTDREKIVAETIHLMENSNEYNRMSQAVNPYGDGRAAKRIVDALLGKSVEAFLPEVTYHPN